MKLAINPATTMPAPFEEDVVAYSAAGFQAMEIWLGKVDKYLEKGRTLQDAARLMGDNGLAPAGACFSWLSFTGDQKEKESLAGFRRHLEMCQAMGARTLVVIPSVSDSPVTEASFDKVVEGLGRCGETAQPYGVSLAIEFIKGFPLIGSVRTATLVARRTRRKNVGVLLDTFHFSAGISKVGEILDMKKGELLLVHLNDCRDVYLETAADNMRVFPGEGILPLKDILKAIAKIGYDGYLSLELFCKDVWDMPVQEAARLSYKKASAFLKGLRLRR